ncbi:MAG: hypothetical protein ABL933_17380 [Methyloglobulus sp.]|nr:hypothetical protein [Methyloglobulus sp.]
MTDPNAPAYPLNLNDVTETGLTKREYFAGLVFQGLLSDPNVEKIPIAAKAAVEYADFLIEALNEGAE